MVRDALGEPLDPPKARLELCLFAAAAGLAVFASLFMAGASWGAGYDPGSDPNSMYATTQYTGAQAWWDAGYTGAGVDVAVIDSGVSPVPGLDSPGKVTYGPDLSIDSQNPNLTNVDGYGHGTFMAGLIAGDQGSGTPSSANSSATVYRGMAPGARIVSIKVATADGGTDVTQVIAAIDWVVQHAHDHGLNIRVLNLSYGTNSTQSYLTDPLAYAVEQAWKHGIVVVAAAGNTGFQRGHGAPGLADPAYDPYVIGVGASDSNGTASIADDSIPSFSASAATFFAKNPDFVAPGAHLQGLRVPNSSIDVNHPEGMLDATYFRGSGTSESAAITSGAVALVLQKYPNLTPDEVKAFFADNASPLAGAPASQEGSGEIDLAAMLTQEPTWAVQRFPNSTGGGSIEQARGTDHISVNGVVLSGERDIFGRRVSTTALASAESSASSWTGGVWDGSSWTGSSWTGSSWSASSWTGSSWTGSSWSASSWSGSSWTGSSWTASSWSDASWT